MANRNAIRGFLSEAAIGVLLISLGPLLPASAAAEPPTHVSSALDVRAHIDGRSRLVIRGSAVRWHHFENAAPGRHGGENLPTYLNGSEWIPTWPDSNGYENRGCDCDSSEYLGIPALARVDQTISLEAIQVRNSAQVVQQPSQGNDYTAILEFDDNPPGGSEWYEVKLTYLTVSGLSIDRLSTPRGGNTGKVTVVAYGAGFDNGASVKLRRRGESDIAGADTVVTADPVTLRTTFDLGGRPEGLWDFVVVNPDGTSTTLTGAFTIVSGGVAKVTLDIMGPNPARAGRDTTFYAIVRNESLVDINLAQLDITADVARSITPPARIASTSDDDAPAQDVQHLVSVSGTQLAPQSTRTVRFAYNLAAPGESATFHAYAYNAYSDHPTYVLPMIVGYRTSEDYGFRWHPVTHQASFHNGMDLAYRPHRNGPIAAMQAGTVTQSVDAEHGGLNGNWVEIDHGGGLVSRYAHLSGRAVTPGQHVEAGQTIGFEGHTGRHTGDHLHWSILRNGTYINPRQWAAEHFLSLPTLGGMDYMGYATLLWSVFNLSAVSSLDPNGIVGPAGYGERRYLRSRELMPYTVLFENKPEATAPAQDVVITNQLDTTKFDVDTFSLRSITFGNHRIEPPEGAKEYSTDVDLRPAKNLLVNIHAGINRDTGILTCKFTSIDPDTGQPPSDAMAGFLPPNVTAPEGEGSIAFTVQSKPGLTTGAEVSDQARITFDANAPIDTSVWKNTIDELRPSSQVLPLSATQRSPRFKVQWSGADTGSGIRNYTIYVSENNEPYAVWLPNTTTTSAVFQGQADKAYRFVSTATDGAGNVEELPPDADATTQTPVDRTPPTITPNFVGRLGGNGWYTGDVTLLWTVSDAESAVTSSSGCDPVTVKEDTTGTTFTCTATSDGGTATKSVAVKRDATKPSLTWNSDKPAGGGAYIYGQVPAAPTCTASDTASGPASCVLKGYSTRVGHHILSATATDKAGNTTIQTRKYTVLPWVLKGFYPPVRTGASWNFVTHGTIVLLTFEVFSQPYVELTDTAAIRDVTVLQTSPSGKSVGTPVKLKRTALRYEAGKFQVAWKTPGITGTCYRVTLTTQDGSTLSAFFRLV